jgi:hypothetical protein
MGWAGAPDAGRHGGKYQFPEFIGRPAGFPCEAAASLSVTGPGTRPPILTTWLLEGRKEYGSSAAHADDGEDLSGCRLSSFLAWDQVSWPGNDFFGGARATDDGVKAAATDSMEMIIGIAGHYCAGRNAYQPPEPYATWGELVHDQRMVFPR